MHADNFLLKEYGMLLGWSILFLVVALLAGVFGFTGIAADAAWIAKLLFVIFLILFLVSVIRGLL